MISLSHLRFVLILSGIAVALAYLLIVWILGGCFSCRLARLRPGESQVRLAMARPKIVQLELITKKGVGKFRCLVHELHEFARIESFNLGG